MTAISANGTVYTLTGQSGAPVIVLVHGLGLTHETWTSHLPALEADYQVLNYDLYGHGASASPPRTPSLRLFAEQLRELMDELGIDTAAIVGFSLGGMINRRFAMDYPQRVSVLAVFNSPHERGTAAQKLVEEQASKAGGGGPGATLDAAIERWFTADFREQRDDMIQNIRGWLLANDPLSYAQCRWVLAAGVTELIRPEPAISHPTLVITCENDSGSTPAMSQAIAAEIDGAQLEIIPVLQHMGLVEQPDAFTRPLLKFLDSTL